MQQKFEELFVTKIKLFTYHFVLGTDDNGILILYVNASFAVHPESNSHIGICTTLVHESMLSLSSKQKSNEKSS